MSEYEMIMEKLLEQRNFHLNTLKNLDFELVMEPSESDVGNIEKLQTETVDQIKKIEQEIAFLTSESAEKIP